MGDGARRRALTTIGVCCLTLGAWSKPAAAHAPAQATGIFLESDRSATSREWVRTNRGVILKGGADEPPRLLCNDAYSATLSEDVPMIAAPDALVVASYYGGIRRIASDGCGVAPTDAELDGQHVLDLAPSADGAWYFALVAPKPAGAGAVLRSPDAGRSWQKVGEIPAFGSALRVAPSDADRVYVTAQVESESGEAIHRLFVSSDGGAEFAANPVTLLDTEVRAYVVAVDPLDADRVLLRVLPGNSDDPERVLLSEDAGETLSEVYSAVGPLVAAFDGETVWLGGQAGLFRSDDRGRSFEAVPSTLDHIGCLLPRDGALSVCAHQDLHFGVFRAAPEQAFELELGFADVTSQVACGEDSELLALCESNMLDWVQENAPSAGGAETSGAAGALPASGGAGSVSAPEPAANPSKASSCCLQPARTGASLPLALGLGLSSWVRRRASRANRTRDVSRPGG